MAAKLKIKLETQHSIRIIDPVTTDSRSLPLAATEELLGTGHWRYRTPCAAQVI